MFEREPIFHDRQLILLDGPITTTSTTFVDIPGAELITGDLGSLGNYQVWMSISVQQSNNNTLINFRALINGVPGRFRTVEFGPSSAGNPQHATVIAQGEEIAANTHIAVQWSVSSGTGQINDLVFMFDGVPEIRVIDVASIGADTYLLETGVDALLKEDGDFLLIE